MEQEQEQTVGQKLGVVSINLEVPDYPFPLTLSVPLHPQIEAEVDAAHKDENEKKQVLAEMAIRMTMAALQKMAMAQQEESKIIMP